MAVSLARERERERESKGKRNRTSERGEAARLEHHPSSSHPRIATRSNNAACMCACVCAHVYGCACVCICVCETSLGQLTRVTERPIFGREARNNGEEM